MTEFKAIVTEEVEANRLLSLEGGNGIPQISITEAGGTPDFRSTGTIKADAEVKVTLKNNPVWLVEAGEDLDAVSFVEVGEKGVLVTSESTGIGYVAESVEEGGIAKLVRKASSGVGERGPQGPKGDKGEPGTDGKDGADGAKGAKGDKGETGAKGAAGAAGKDGFPTEAQWDDLVDRVTALEG